MSGCIDIEIGKKLPAYELGMLNEKESDEFELHLLRCEECRSKVKESHETSMLMLTNYEMRDTAEKISKETEPKEIPVPTLWKRILPASLVIFAIVIILVLRPWQVDIKLTKEAIAASNRIAIIGFENMADPENNQQLGKIAANLLITDLAESEYVSVLSGQRLSDIATKLGIDEFDRHKINEAQKIATEAKARWLIMGSIVQESPNMVMAVQLIDIPSGTVEKAFRFEGKTGDNIFTMVDSISARVRDDLLAPQNIGPEPNPHIADITTNSEEAYRYYLDGLENLYKHYVDEALKDFDRAIEIDSTFAMAYFYLSKYRLDTAQDLISKAVKYSKGASRREKYLIAAQEAIVSGDYQKAFAELEQANKKFPDDKDILFELGLNSFKIGHSRDAVDYLNKVIELDPRSEKAYNQIAYAYQNLGDYDDAIAAINKYIELAPGEPNPYDSRGDIFVLAGKIEDAIDSFEKAVSIKPDFRASLLSLANLYLLNGEYDNSEKYFSKLTLSSNLISYVKGKLGLVSIKLRQGLYSQSLNELDQLANSDLTGWTEKDAKIIRGRVYLLKSIVLEEMKNYPEALEVFDRFAESAKSDSADEYQPLLYFKIQLLAENGEMGKAEREISGLSYDSTNDGNYFNYWYAQGMLARAEGNNKKYLESFLKANEHPARFNCIYYLADAYLKSAQPEKAIELLENYSPFQFLWDSYDIIWKTKMYYLLGQAYEMSGNKAKAIEQYDRFLEIYKNADPGIEEVSDTKSRLERLKTDK